MSPDDPAVGFVCLFVFLFVYLMFCYLRLRLSCPHMIQPWDSSTITSNFSPTRTPQTSRNFWKWKYVLCIRWRGSQGGHGERGGQEAPEGHRDTAEIRSIFAVRSPRFWVSGYCTRSLSVKTSLRNSIITSSILADKLVQLLATKTVQKENGAWSRYEIWNRLWSSYMAMATNTDQWKWRQIHISAVSSYTAAASTLIGSLKCWTLFYSMTAHESLRSNVQMLFTFRVWSAANSTPCWTCSALASPPRPRGGVAKAATPLCRPRPSRNPAESRNSNASSRNSSNALCARPTHVFITAVSAESWYSWYRRPKLGRGDVIFASRPHRDLGWL